jgi:carboxyl-terminal processing protease
MGPRSGVGIGLISALPPVPPLSARNAEYSTGKNMPVRNIILLFLATLVSFACYVRADRNRYAATVSEAMEVINRNYVEDISRRELYEGAMKGMTAELDPYSSYIAPQDFNYLREELDQEFGGIGVLIEFNRETNRPTVVSPLVDTPAAEAGVRAGDVILAIDGQDTSDMTFRDTLETIRGKPGEVVRLTVLHIGEEVPVDLDIARAIIPIESVLGDHRLDDGTWDFHLHTDPRIAYIRLVTFGENSVEELRESLRDVDVEAILLDLRDNAGGLLTAAVETCDLFVDEGTIVTIRGRDRVIREQYVATPEIIVDQRVPMVILVNHYSASASEIVAACLQDHRRAKVIGQRTWGKGTVQNIIELEGGDAALKLTTASYWRPNGKNIHRLKDAEETAEWGVTPDAGFEVKLSEEEADAVRRMRRKKDTEGITQPGAEDGDGLEDAEDPQLRKAVEYLQQQLGSRGR